LETLQVALNLFLGVVERLGNRTNLYSKEDIDAYRVEGRGKKSGAAMRRKTGKTGPTVREIRKARKQDKEAA